MVTCIALLRGVNVGGRNPLPMKELVEILEGLGCRNVKTYVQSGNAVFLAAGNGFSRIGKQVGSEIKKRKGFEPHVLVLAREALEKAIQGNPFPEAEDDTPALHFGFLSAAPKNPDLDKLESLKSKSERFRLKGAVFYLHAPDGIGRSKLAAASERLLGVDMTDRNWKTVRALREMARAAG